MTEQEETEETVGANSRDTRVCDGDLLYESTEAPEYWPDCEIVLISDRRGDFQNLWPDR